MQMDVPPKTSRELFQGDCGIVKTSQKQRSQPKLEPQSSRSPLLFKAIAQYQSGIVAGDRNNDFVE
jgi:hypothetical protein